MNVCIIGAGWYGCHAALVLRRGGVRVTLMDQSGVFHGSSSKNQNRLHLGYHYPRSPDTIEECRRGYAKFLDAYGGVALPMERNYYLIHADSKTSLEDYRLQFQTGHREDDRSTLEFATRSVCDTIFVVQERLIDTRRIQETMVRDLSDCLTICASPTIAVSDSSVTVNGVDYDYVLNCTNNQYNPIPVLPPAVYETFCTFLYRLPGDVPIGLTVMDGPFFSIYPYDPSTQTYTVTHVVYGVLSRTSSGVLRTIDDARRDTERSVASVFPDLPMTYLGYFTSNKTKYDFVQDDRSLRRGRQGRYFSFSGGKITGIFEMESVVTETILCQ